MDKATYDKIFGGVTAGDAELINKIAHRFHQHITEMDIEPRPIWAIEMDVTAAHNSCPMKLQELLEADDFNFVHDLSGIQGNLNRETGELENFFVPRFAKSIKEMTDAEIDRLAWDGEGEEYEAILEEQQRRQEEQELEAIDDDRERQALGLVTRDPARMMPS